MVAQPDPDLDRFLDELVNGKPFTLSGIFSASLAAGTAGGISLRAPDITVTEGGIVATSTLGAGDAGSIALDAERIRVLNGA